MFLKNPAEQAWAKWCRRSGWTQGRIAAAARLGRCHVSQVLAGTRGGRNSWKHILAVLPDEGISLLKQCPAWNGWAQTALNQFQSHEHRQKDGNKTDNAGDGAAAQPDPA
jgi:hypothetical protein